MGIADIYYNIEDKWYDFLDFLESKRIPVYKVVDPVENAGVPTLPVFVALLLLGAYFLFSGLGAPGAPRTIEITVEVSSGGSLLNGVDVGTYADSKSLETRRTDADGKVVFNLLPGTVTISLSKEGCDARNETITVSEKRTVQLNLTCQGGVAPSYIEITVLDQDNRSVMSGDATLLSDDNREIGRYHVVGGVLTIPNVTFDRLSLMSSTGCGNVLIDRVDLGSTIIVNCKSATVETVSLTVDTYFGTAKVSNIPVYLVAEGGAVLAQSQVTADGSTTFSVGKGTPFYIKTEATSVYEAYASDRTSVSSDSEKGIYLSKGEASSTLNVSDNSTKKPLSGVRVTILDGAVTVLERTMTSASETFSLHKKNYVVVAFKDGYARFTGPLTGGQNISLLMNPIDKNKTGSLYVLVYERGTDLPVPGVSVNVFDEGGVPIGMGAALTNFNGETTFSGIPAMKVKPVASKGGDTYKPSPEVVEIKAGQTTEAYIPIIHKQLNLTVNVLHVNGSYANSSSVYLYLNDRTFVNSGLTNIRGRASLTAAEGSTYYVVAEFYDQKTGAFYRTTSESFQMAADRELTLTLRPVEANATFTGFYKFSSDAAQDPPNVLAVKERYYAKFAVGLLDGYNETVFETSLDKNYAFFFNYDYIWSGDNTPAIENKSDNIRITWKNFRNNTETVKIPVYALNSTSGTRLNYTVTWKRDSKVLSASGSIAFNITGEGTTVSCDRTEPGICFTLAGDTQVGLYTDVNVNLTLQYEGFEKLDQIKIGGRNVGFYKDPAVSAGSSNRSAAEINVTGLNLSAGGVLQINVTANATRIGKANDTGNYPAIWFSIGGKKFAEHKFNVTGKYAIKAPSLSPDSIGCLDDTKDITVTVNYTTGEPVKGATVKIGDKNGTTGSNGRVTIDNVAWTDADITVEATGDEIERSTATLKTASCEIAMLVGNTTLTFYSTPSSNGTEVTIFNNDKKKSFGVTVSAYVLDYADNYTVSPEKKELTVGPWDVDKERSGESKFTIKVDAKEGAKPSKMLVKARISSREDFFARTEVTLTMPSAVKPPEKAEGIVNPDFSDPGGKGWSKFETPISACNTGATCDTKDKPEAINLVGEANVTSGTTGYCGEAGINQTVRFPSGAKYLKFSAAAYKAKYGGVSGIKIDDQWLQKFEGTANKIQTWDWKVYYADISAFAGKTGNLKIVIEDKDPQNCNQADHAVWIKADNFSIETSKPTELTGVFAALAPSGKVLDKATFDANSGDLAKLQAMMQSNYTGTKLALEALYRALSFTNASVSKDGDKAGNWTVLNMARVRGIGTLDVLNYLCNRTGQPSSCSRIQILSGAFDIADKIECGWNNVSFEVSRSFGSNIWKVIKLEPKPGTCTFDNASQFAGFLDNVNVSSDTLSEADRGSLGTYAKDLLTGVWGFADCGLVGWALEPPAGCAVSASVRFVAPGNYLIVKNCTAANAGDAKTNCKIQEKGVTQPLAANVNWSKYVEDGIIAALEVNSTGSSHRVAVYVKDSANVKTVFEALSGFYADKKTKEILYESGNPAVLYVSASAPVAPPTGCVPDCTSDEECKLVDAAYKCVKKPVVPSGKTLMDLVSILDKACTVSDDNEGAQYGDYFWGDNGRPIVLAGPFNFSAATAYKYVGSKCTQYSIDKLDAKAWNDINGKAYTDNACSSANRINLHDTADEDAPADGGWDFSIEAGKAYDEIAMQYYTTPSLGDLRDCTVRSVRRPQIAVESPAGTVAKGSEFSVKFNYTAGFQGSGTVYVYFDNDSLNFRGSSPGATPERLADHSYRITLPVTGISKDADSKGVTAVFYAAQEGAFNISYSAKDDAWRVCKPADLAISGAWEYDWLGYPQAGECALGTNLVYVPITVGGTATPTLFDAAMMIADMCKQSNSSANSVKSTDKEYAWPEANLYSKSGSPATCKPATISELNSSNWLSVASKDYYSDSGCIGTPKRISLPLLWAYSGSSIAKDKAYAQVNVTHFGEFMFVEGCSVSAAPKT